MNWIINFIINQVSDRVTSWQTTIPGALLAFIDGLSSHFIDPNNTHLFDQHVAQWLVAGLSLVLLAWKDRKQPPSTPTPAPGNDQ